MDEPSDRIGAAHSVGPTRGWPARPGPGAAISEGPQGRAAPSERVGRVRVREVATVAGAVAVDELVQQRGGVKAVEQVVRVTVAVDRG